ncbi:MAG TPA: alpha/beta hydrolase [Stellaceae bacterium]|nr:alpha/beta hydrolase [Stellaceae bacterium]
MLLLAGLAGSCVDMRVDHARRIADDIAEAAGFSARLIETPQFTLLSYQRFAPREGSVLDVYIEGDGLAWINRTQISDDPTPSDPLALRMAAADDAPNVLYLARPCQFVAASNDHCDPKYWAESRYAPEIVEATNNAVDQALARSDAHRVELVGYSGGGVLAALVAARRNDVVRVITVGANLDLPFWTNEKHVSPLSGSLSPTDERTALGRIPQVMFVGGRDDIVPPSVANHYRAALPVGAPAIIVTISEFSHTCCWATAWPDLIRRARSLP